MADDTNSPRRGPLVAFGALQVALALGWVTYAVYLPELAARAGVAARWVLVILLVDQLIFAFTDALAGIALARLAAWRRLLPWLLAGAVVSSGLFVALPWASGTASSTLFLGVVILWTVTTAALRVPPFALLAERLPLGAQSASRMLALAVGVAGIVAPFLVSVLRGTSPFVPFALASVAVCAAAFIAIAWTAQLPERARSPRSAADTGRAFAPLAWVAIAGLFAFGAQLHAAVASPTLWPVQGQGGLRRELLLAVFWSGIGAGAIVGAFVRTAGRRPACAAAALAFGAGALGVAGLVPASPTLACAQFVAGLAWGFGLVVIFDYASEYSQTTARWVIGSLFGALALAAAARLLLAATSLPAELARVSLWLAPLAWVAALGLALYLQVRAPRRTDP